MHPKILWPNNKRFAYLQSIITGFLNIIAQRRGDVLADVTSAEELSNKFPSGGGRSESAWINELAPVEVDRFYDEFDIQFYN